MHNVQRSRRAAQRRSRSAVPVAPRRAAACGARCAHALITHTSCRRKPRWTARPFAHAATPRTSRNVSTPPPLDAAAVSAAKDAVLLRNEHHTLPLNAVVMQRNTRHKNMYNYTYKFNTSAHYSVVMMTSYNLRMVVNLYVQTCKFNVHSNSKTGANSDWLLCRVLVSSVVPLEGLSSFDLPLHDRLSS